GSHIGEAGKRRSAGTSFRRRAPCSSAWLPPIGILFGRIRRFRPWPRPAAGIVWAALPPELGEFVVEFRQGLVEVGDEAVVGDLEDRGLFVLVDRDDDLRILHAGEVLDRARNA